MKFLINAQLPRRLAHQLRAAGLETTHTLDLPEGNRTSPRSGWAVDKELKLLRIHLDSSCI
jgi:predicted nuclease of predicted toxin-antitoxin system